MTDEEYKSFLAALAKKHLSLQDFRDPKELERLNEHLRQLIRVSRHVQDLREELHREGLHDGLFVKDLLHELKDVRIGNAFEAMDRIGMINALDDAADAVFANLRRSAIPDESVELLYRAGIPNPELELIITIEYARRRLGSSREGLSRDLRNTVPVDRELVDRLEKALSDLGKNRENQPPKKRKILNGIGKILGGAIAGVGNVLLACGTIIALNPATGYGAIASGAVAVAGVMQGAGDLRGE
jgi:hypothetical protein